VGIKIAKDGYKFIAWLGASAVATLGLGLFYDSWFLYGISFILLSLSIMCAIFFRDPARTVKKAYQDGNHIISPADGTIDVIEKGVVFDGAKYDKISIFLSVFDVHINRAPVTGVITYIKHKRGEFLNAMRPKSEKCNERKYIHFRTETGFNVVMVQVAGYIARRIVGFRNCEVGRELQAGERLGLIRFGSRVTVYIPADSFYIKAQIGEKVVGGVSLLATAI
jgi:phosphatidylserine decarboxylase